MRISGSNLGLVAILPIISTLTHTLLAITLLNADHAQNYVDSIIQQFEEDSQRFSCCSFIYPPLPPLGSPKEAYFLPKLLIWSPQEQFGIAIKCPEHGNELRPYQWTSDVSGKGGEMARLIYDLMGNVILVQRIYLCANGRQRHKLRATTPDVHNVLPSYIKEYFPAVIFLRCSVSKTVIHFIDTEIAKGVNFLKISEGLASLNYREYLQRRRIYLSACDDVAVNASDSSEFNNNILYSFPSNDQLMKIFLYNFEKNRAIYLNDMNSLSVSSLSCDHTFKISRNVGLVRETDNSFVTQFHQLFITLNEVGEVVAWRLTKSTAFSEIEDLLIELEKRTSLRGNTIELVCVDDCCHVRSKYVSVFPNVAVKLDLFHACQRITRTFSRQNALYNDVTKDFVQIFREDNDQGETRLNKTPNKEKIERNLNSFIERWSNIPHSPLTNVTFTEIANLRQHVQKGCLSDIPPGCGTERNEGLHRLLNRSLISGATRISVELAIALLTILFYHHNKKISAEKHMCSTKIKPVAPDDANAINESQTVMSKNVPFRKGISTSKEGEPARCSVDPNREVSHSQSSDPLIVMADCIEDLCQESVAGAIITEMLNVRELIENVNRRSCDRSFNALDFLHLNKMSKLLNVEDSIMDTDDPTINSNEQTLQRHLAKFNLELDNVQPDGDCAFRSIVRQISKRANEEPATVSTHLKSLGLLIDEDVDTFTLRQLFVDAVLSDKCGISSFIEGGLEEVLRKAREFRTKGIFDREIGDVVLRVCCNILQIPIVVITSSQTVPCLSFKCDQSVTNEPIFLAYHYYGAGHYDATESKTSGKGSEENEKHVKHFLHSRIAIRKSHA